MNYSKGLKNNNYSSGLSLLKSKKNFPEWPKTALSHPEIFKSLENFKKFPKKKTDKKTKMVLIIKITKY